MLLFMFLMSQLIVYDIKSTKGSKKNYSQIVTLFYVKFKEENKLSGQKRLLSPWFEVPVPGRWQHIRRCNYHRSLEQHLNQKPAAPLQPDQMQHLYSPPDDHPVNKSPLKLFSEQ